MDLRLPAPDARARLYGRRATDDASALPLVPAAFVAQVAGLSLPGSEPPHAYPGAPTAPAGLLKDARA